MRKKYSGSFEHISEVGEDFDRKTTAVVAVKVSGFFSCPHLVYPPKLI